VVKFNKEEFLNKLRERIYILDGAMGTELQKRGFVKGCPENLNIENSQVIKDIHKSYADAGSDIIITNTFGASKLKLSNYGLANKVKEINEAGVRIAREACPGCIVAGDIGPLGRYLEPLDEITFDEAYDIFKEQVESLKKADVLIIETMSDIKMLKAALIAAKDNFQGAIIVSGTFEELRTTTGTDVKTFTVIADSLGADVIGANCSAGPDGLYEVAKIICKHTNKAVVIQPNAGLPLLEEGRTVFKEKPEKLGRFAEKAALLGVNIIGGCCGTGPEHIAEITKVKNKKIVKREIRLDTMLCSRTKTVDITGKTVIVGERINPTNKKDLQEEIRQGKTNLIRKYALEQVKEGATLLDINAGVVGADEEKALKNALDAVQNVVDVPLVIDSSNILAIEAALKQSDGKCLINSVNGTEKSLRSVLPLAKRYGAAIIALCLDHEGIPKTAEKRLDIAKRIIKEAEKIGIKKEDIIVDCLVLTIATNPENEKIILEAVKKVKRLGYKTILGISNISHGLPNRSEINSKFLTKASKSGLDLAIINPLDNIMQEDTEIRFLEEEVKIKKEDYDNLPIEKQLHNAVLYGDKDNIVEIVESALKKLKALEINDILVKALQEVGVKFNKKEYFLPQVLLSASAMKNAFNRLRKELKKEGKKEEGIILFATVENDIHDIGKNIVIALLESNNFKVVDLGKNVSTKSIIDKTKKIKPDVIALSALMTTTIGEMEAVVRELRERNINIPVLIGGAVVTIDYANHIKAHFGKDAIEAVGEVKRIINGKNN